MISRWHKISVDALEKTLAAIPSDADAKTIRKAVREAYPFGERKHWPYRKWCEAQGQMLHLRFPKLFQKPRRRPRELLSGEPSLFNQIAEPIPPKEAKALKPVNNLSPVMRQYQQFKEQYPDYVLFFRMGDFYELFFEDAEMAAQVLGITLTKRGEVPMAGVPFHSVEAYLKKLIAAGHKAAICEQVENSAGKKIERRVVRQVDPSSAADAA